MAYETIKYEVAEQILTITLNRPDKLNAFNGTMQQELIDAFDAADKDDNVRAIAAVDQVVVRATLDDIGTAEPLEDVVPGEPGDDDRRRVDRRAHHQRDGAQPEPVFFDPARAAKIRATPGWPCARWARASAPSAPS